MTPVKVLPGIASQQALSVTVDLFPSRPKSLSRRISAKIEFCGTNDLSGQDSLFQATTASPPIQMSSSRETHVLILCLVLVAATLAFYNPIIHNQFIDFDDSAYIVKNPSIQGGLTWDSVKWSFTTFREGNWHPLTWLSHALDYSLFRLNPLGHHYTNLLLHAANAVLLFLLLRRATASTWRSLCVAALFALHPLNVESVAWAAERKNVLSMLFFLLALYAYDRYAHVGERRLYFAVVVLFIFGLMAKPQIVTLPFVLLLWDYWPLQRIGARSPTVRSDGDPARRSLAFLIWEKTPLFAIAAADSIVTLIAQRSGNAVRTLTEVPLPARLENAFASYLRYIDNAVWPSRLALMYSRPENSLPGWQVTGAVVLLVGLSLLAFRFRHQRYLLVGWLWFLGTLVPMIGIITVGEQSMADRYAYLPMVGLFLTVVWGSDALLSRYAIPNFYRAALAVVALLVLGCLTTRQLGYWHDDETIWRHTLNVTKSNYMAHNYLAIALARQERSDEAVAQFEAATALHKYPPSQILTLALYELRVGHFKEAAKECNAVLRTSADPTIQEAATRILTQAQANLQ